MNQAIVSDEIFQINTGGKAMSYKILVVDDTAFMRKMAADCLIKHGHTVVGEAVNGKDGIEKYKELSPDIVMMDLTMPEMNGIDAIKEIIKLNAQAVILVCSASNQQEQIFDALEAGAKGYLTKPFVSDRMNEVIRKYAEPFLIKDRDSEDIADEVQDEVQEEVQEEENEVFLDADEQIPDLDEQEVPDVMNSTNEVKVMKSNKANLSNFITSYMCNWNEEINDETTHYAVVCSEKEDKISIEMTGKNNEKQVIQFTFDGFQQLNNWIESHLGDTMVKAN